MAASRLCLVLLVLCAALDVSRAVSAPGGGNAAGGQTGSTNGGHSAVWKVNLEPKAPVMKRDFEKVAARQVPLRHLMVSAPGGGNAAGGQTGSTNGGHSAVWKVNLEPKTPVMKRDFEKVAARQVPLRHLMVSAPGGGNAAGGQTGSTNGGHSAVWKVNLEPKTPVMKRDFEKVAARQVPLRHLMVSAPGGGNAAGGQTGSTNGGHSAVWKVNLEPKTPVMKRDFEKVAARQVPLRHLMVSAPGGGNAAGGQTGSTNGGHSAVWKVNLEPKTPVMKRDFEKVAARQVPLRRLTSSPTSASNLGLSAAWKAALDPKAPVMKRDYEKIADKSVVP